MSKVIFIFLIFVFSFTFLSRAETIKLKNGKTVEAKIIEKTDNYIKLDINSIPITYYFDELSLD